jgi:hypothetical protein
MLTPNNSGTKKPSLWRLYDALQVALKRWHEKSGNFVK